MTRSLRPHQELQRSQSASRRFGRVLPALLVAMLYAASGAAETMREAEESYAYEDKQRTEDQITSKVSRDGNPDIVEMRETAARADNESLFLEEREAMLNNIYDNPAFDKRTAEVLRDQVESGFADFGIYTQDSDTILRDQGDLDRLEPEDVDIGLFDANDIPVEGIGKLSPSPLFPLDAVLSQHSVTKNYIESDCTGPGPCDFPAAYDAKSPLVFLLWRGGDFAGSQLEEHVYGWNGKSLRLYVNGTLLAQGASFGQLDFHAWVSSGGCGTSQTSPCLATVVERAAWFPANGPWTTWNVKVELWETQQLSIPMIDFDKWGNPVTITSEQVKLLERSDVVIPDPDLQSFWLNTIGFTVMHERCTTCHTMDTPAKIEFQHGGIASANSVVAINSLLVPNESVLHCSNCHEQQLPYLSVNSQFPEHIWATPTPQLDINWAQIMLDHPTTWPSEICNRMTNHLPTHAQREQHFHEDARLFWAVEKGEIPIGFPDVETAPPSNYNMFIERFDTWNDSGAPCPQ